MQIAYKKFKEFQPKEEVKRNEVVSDFNGLDPLIDNLVPSYLSTDSLMYYSNSSPNWVSSTLSQGRVRTVPISNNSVYHTFTSVTE